MKKTYRILLFILVLCSAAPAFPQRLNLGLSANAFSLFFVKNKSEDANATLLAYFMNKAQVKTTLSAGAGPLINLDFGRFSLNAEAKAYRMLPVKFDVAVMDSINNYDYVSSKLHFNSFEVSGYIGYTFFPERTTRFCLETGLTYVRPTKKSFLQNYNNLAFYQDLLSIENNYTCALLGLGLKRTGYSFTLRYVRKITHTENGNVFGSFTLNYCKFINFAKLRRNHIFVD
ncbi:MAG: hypothetical protein V2A54_15410 [Bacteroidota bacterium]